MSVVLKSQKSAVVDALRAVRNADDELSRIKEHSWETRRSKLSALVESSSWRYGPAELLATFEHHVVVKAPNGSLVQVEWTVDKAGDYALERAVVHETVKPVADLGQELIETAKSAVDAIFEGDDESAQKIISALAEALDTGGDLQRRVATEVSIRSLSRDAWWHQVVGIREGVTDTLPAPVTEGDDCLAKSINDLLVFLKESATEASGAMRTLANSELAKDIETLARDIAEDTGLALDILVKTDSKDQDEALKVYEAVMTVAPQLLNGIEFLKELVAEHDNSPTSGQE